MLAMPPSHQATYIFSLYFTKKKLPLEPSICDVVHSVVQGRMRHSKTM